MRRAGTVSAAAIAGVVVLAAPATAATASWKNVKIAGTKGSMSFVAAGAKGSAMTIGTVNSKVAISSWTGKAWAAKSSPVQFLPSALAVASPTNAWAGGIGSLTASGPGVSIHWNGKTWKKVAFPAWTLPLGMAASTDGGAWALAGLTRDGGSPSELLRWTGSAWSVVSLGAPANTAFTALSAKSKSNVWVTGTYSPDGLAEYPIVYHYNGKTWSKATAPAGSWGVPAQQNVFSAVETVSATSVWAARAQNTSYLLHYNGKTWQQIHLPNLAEPLSLADDGHGGVWVGFSGSPKKATYLHWNGSKWAYGYGPARSGATTVNGLAHIPGTKNVWGAGGTSKSGVQLPFIERFS
jgi:hypothetical protein